MEKELKQSVADGRQSPENIELKINSDKKENTETVKKDRCEPCMHCGVHCIFLREDEESI